MKKMKNTRKDEREQQPSAGGIHLGHINVDGLENAGKHVDMKGSSKFNFKKIIITIVLIATGAATLINGIPHYNKYLNTPNIPYSIEDTISLNSDSIFIDELCANGENSILLEQVGNIELYLQMSTKLDELHLERYTENVTPVEETESFENDLETKYQSFVALVAQTDKDILSQDAIKLYQLAAELNGYKKIVDSKITTEGYSILSKFGILVVKSSLLSGSGMSYTNIENSRIPWESEEYVINYTDPSTGKEFVTSVPAVSIIHRVMECVYDAQSLEDVAEEELSLPTVKKDLNKFLNYIKVAMFSRYENNGSLKSTVNYDEIREKVKTK